MGYLQALQLMVRAYKAARGAMPKGLDLLKLKLRARQKAIDSKKVIEFPKDRITNPFKQRPKSESEAQMLARMKRQNKEAVQRLKEKKKPRDDKATGGIANLSSVYDNNPTLQAQFPDKQDYLDLFSSTTTTTPQTQTYAQMTQQQPAAGIPAVKPIIPIPEFGDDDDITTTIGRGRTASNQPNYMGGKEPGIVAALQRTYSDLKGPLITYNPMNPAFLFNVGKAGVKKAREFADKERARQKAIALAFEEEMRRREEDRIRSQSPSGSMDYGPSGYEGMSDAASDQERSEGGRGSRG